ncbi:mannose/glucose-specific lectin-like [Cocos nucifera]|uniref:Mannose/glucose-specific lectin-like n=1 Tax=Cocos nucifera TaxID=13894 RepID=A0A8K0NCN7_COCNU|nr:mannose/glucose-specific lectin-like [Cocos nucifera]
MTSFEVEFDLTYIELHSDDEASGEDVVVVVGPWGGSGGTEWLFQHALTITKIKLTVGDVINSITFQYMDGETAKWSPRYGGGDGKPVTIEFGTNDYLKCVSGYYGSYHGHTVIKSLKFVTNSGPYGPYGQEEGTAFSLPVTAGSFVAFYGNARQWLDALGFHLRPN